MQKGGKNECVCIRPLTTFSFGNVEYCEVMQKKSTEFIISRLLLQTSEIPAIN